jgi:hypothetical protein
MDAVGKINHLLMGGSSVETIMGHTIESGKGCFVGEDASSQ